MTRKFLAIVLLAAGLGAATWGLRHDWSPDQQGAAAESDDKHVEPGMIQFRQGAVQLSSVMTEKAESVPLPLAEPLNGRIVVDEDFTARVSVPIAGRVLELHAQIGDPVRRGQPLVVMDAPDLGAAQSDLHKARSDERQKELAFRRARELVEGGVLARKELETAENDLNQSRAEAERAALRVANLNPKGQPLAGQRMALMAPVGGVVVDRHANPGMEARPDLPDPLFLVSDLAHLQVIIDLPEQYLPKVAVGQPVELGVDAWPGSTFEARIQRIAPAVDPATRRIQVRCRLDNRDLRLKPEMYAKVTLVAGKDQRAIRVHNAALITEGLYAYVFVEGEPGTFRKRKVDLSVQDREFSYIAAGLAAGERVVTRGALLLNAEMAETQ